MISDCGLVDLRSKGQPFTRYNKQEDGILVKEKVNRGLFNVLWIEEFLKLHGYELGSKWDLSLSHNHRDMAKNIA